MGSKGKTALRFVVGTAVIALVVSSAHAGDMPPALSGAELVRKAVQNEILANNNSGSHFLFKNQRKTAQLWQTKLIIETSDATAGIMVAQNGHPLTPEQQKAEQARLENYVRNPEELNKKRKLEMEDAEHTIRIMKALPDAFLYEADGTVQGTAELGRPGDELVRLKFHPNPNYNPPSRVEQVLTGMHGVVLIDARDNRLAEIDGTLAKEVGFGWGILGHLDRGGRFLVCQADVGNGQWEVTRMELSFTGKVLLFKKLDIRSNDTFSDFQPVPRDLTFAQGVDLLKKQVAAGQAAEGTRNSKPAEKSQGEAHNQGGKPSKEEAQAEEHVCCNR